MEGFSSEEGEKNDVGVFLMSPNGAAALLTLRDGGWAAQTSPGMAQ